MIVDAFIRWAKTAKSADRTRAASVLCRAYLGPTMPEAERTAAREALTWLLDDPSPRVREALATGLAHAEGAPRHVILGLSKDQPEISSHVILFSPLLSDADLVELVQMGIETTNMLVASRPALSARVSATLATLGEEEELACLLENGNVRLSADVLREIGRRFGDRPSIRNLLAERGDLPADTRHLLMGHVSDALSGAFLVKETLSANRLAWATREARETGTMLIAGDVPDTEIFDFVDQMRERGQITPACLMHALCSGRINFFVSAIADLSGYPDRRVRSLMASGRPNAARALLEAAGLDRDLSQVFVEAILLWRSYRKAADDGLPHADIPARLLARFNGKHQTSERVVDLLKTVERLDVVNQRMKSQSYAERLVA